MLTFALPKRKKALLLSKIWDQQKKEAGQRFCFKLKEGISSF